MNFDLSELQTMLVDTASSFAKKESPVDRMRALRDDPIGYETKMWRHMAELGWLGIVFPESLGGYGGRFIDAALLIEKLGTTLVPEPLVPSVILGGMAILRAGTEEQQKRWLTRLIEGEITLALAYAERTGRYDLAATTTRATERGDGFVLSGEKIFVQNGHNADTLVVSARIDGSSVIGLFAIDKGAPGLAVEPVKTMDGRRAATIRLDGVEVPGDRVLGSPEEGGTVLGEVLDLAAAAACAEGLGIASAVLDMTVEYLKVREQFEVKIGSFQALQHRAVDMFIEVELCRSMTICAALEAENPDLVARESAISAAKVQLNQGGRYVVRQGVQLHGGIGCTDAHDIGLYFKRMQVLGALYGDDVYHAERFSRMPGFDSNARDLW